MRSYDAYKAHTEHFNAPMLKHPYEQAGTPLDMSSLCKGVDWCVVLSEEDVRRFYMYLDQIAYRFEKDYILCYRVAEVPLRLRHYTRDLDGIKDSNRINACTHDNSSFGTGTYCYRASDCTEPCDMAYVDFDWKGTYLQCVFGNDGYKDDPLVPEIFLLGDGVDLSGRNSHYHSKP